MSGRVFIDTNILIYAHVSNEPEKHDIALTLLRDNLTGSRLWISTQILNEFYSAMSKNKYNHENIVEYISAMTPNMNVLAVTLAIVESALHVKGRYQFSYWDSLMLAAALESRSEVVYTEDLQHNQVIEGRLTVINPFMGLS